jgi:hypothetical protein
MAFGNNSVIFDGDGLTSAELEPAARLARLAKTLDRLRFFSPPRPSATSRKDNFHWQGRDHGPILLGFEESGADVVRR